MCERETILSEIKVVTSIQGVTVNNALILNNGLLQFGAPLVKNTDVTGAFALNLGTTGSRLTEVNARASSQNFIEFNNGSVAASLLFNSSGILLTSTVASARGLLGASDFSANYNDNTYTQKIYVDNKIGGRNINSLIKTAGAGQDGYSVRYNHAGNEYTLLPNTLVAGSDTQVIYNDGGALVGKAPFIFNKTTDRLSVTGIDLGISATTGTTRSISAIGTSADIDIQLLSKGAGSINLGISTGHIYLGESTLGDATRMLTATGTIAQIDIALQPKGADGVVYVGNVAEAGANRYIGARGSASDINLEIRPKGTNGEVLVGTTNAARTLSIIRGSSSGAICSLRLASKNGMYVEASSGVTIFGGSTQGTLQIGAAGTDGGSTRSIVCDGTSSQISLFISSKGTGKLYLNDVTRIPITLSNWDMLSDGSKTVAHGLSDTSKLEGIDFVVYDDTGKPFSGIRATVGVYISDIDATSIEFTRIGGSIFDSTGFDDPGIRRIVVNLYVRV